MRRFFRSLFIVTAIHLLAAFMVFGVYQFAQIEKKNQSTATGSGMPNISAVTSEGRSKPSSPHPQRMTPMEPSSSVLTHVVKPGESYWSIAQRYGIPLRTLLVYNGVDSNTTLRPGQRLKIPVSQQR
ncbi:MAG: LysM peptidoglycan-binding domain-containing protein [Lentisphaerae bacterium]|nr:MAG: LysM peptidoglycan-binding domain-containing protein [Lentisphaerota bacterium]